MSNLSVQTWTGIGFCCVDFDIGGGGGVEFHIHVLSFVTVLTSLEIIKIN